ncbi:MAG: cysteine desulfurase family protein [Candidatus Baltobacteraceae bacterium]
MNRIYLDFAATTPLRSEVLEAMLPYFSEVAHNPSSLHGEGRRARAALDGARERVATLLGARPREVIFTGGGSEADNLAILGVARARRARHVVTAANEHHAVLHAFDRLREDGVDVTILPVDSEGRVAPEAFAAALRDETAFASIALANNEYGTVNPIAQLAALAHARDVVFHSDAVQAPGMLELDLAKLGVDLLSLSAHKFYGPKGVGALYVRAGTPLAAQMLGGGQEAGLRAGTENVAGAVGFARAFELALGEMPATPRRIGGLRDRLLEGLLARIPQSALNGPRAPRLPNNLNLGIEGVDGPTVAIRLDLEGVAASNGSACNAGAAQVSHAVIALGERAAARASIRFSLGRASNEQEVGRVLDVLPEIVAELREGNLSVGRNEGGPLGRSDC